MTRPKLNAGSIAGYLNDAVILEFLERSLALLSGKVLDIGCGHMRYKETILSAPAVTAYTGLDLEAGKFSYAVEADLYWDGARMPLADNSIDSAILFEVLEHCPDPRVVLAEALRVLKPGGAILFSTPFLYPLHGVPYDYQRLTSFGAEHLFASAGFVDVAIEAGGAWDAGLGQTLALWVATRPMPELVRRILRRLYVPLFALLLHADKKYRPAAARAEGAMITGILGSARKPLI